MRLESPGATPRDEAASGAVRLASPAPNVRGSPKSLPLYDGFTSTYVLASYSYLVRDIISYHEHITYIRPGTAYVRTAFIIILTAGSPFVCIDDYDTCHWLSRKLLVRSCARADDPQLTTASSSTRQQLFRVISAGFVTIEHAIRMDGIYSYIHTCTATGYSVRCFCCFVVVSELFLLSYAYSYCTYIRTCLMYA